ncbi:MAG: GlcG/HbpS family heme-binding protein [Steroidobacteraceae bacterium]
MLLACTKSTDSPDRTMLTLDQASTIVDSALSHGRRAAFKPLCIVVLDAGGHVLALKRDEQASLFRPQIATAKAAGCLGLGFGGRDIAQRAQGNPAFYAALAGILPSGLVPVAGGVLIRDTHGALLGAVGVTGDNSDNDEACALAGIRAAGLVADTGAPAAGKA